MPVGPLRIGEHVQVPRLERLGESERRLLPRLSVELGVGERRQVGVDRADRGCTVRPDAAGTAARVLRSADLLSGLARIVAEQIPTFAAVDPPLLDDAAAMSLNTCV